MNDFVFDELAEDKIIIKSHKIILYYLVEFFKKILCNSHYFDKKIPIHPINNPA